MIVLVCGGRDFDDRDLVFRTLDAVHTKTPVRRLIVGDATGADTMAHQWAESRILAVGGETRRFVAQWEQFGRAAGPRRNAAMLRQCPDLVVAFPGGRGTADMIRQAKAAGVPVIRVSDTGIEAWHPDGSLFGRSGE